MKFEAPQIVWLILCAIHIGIALEKQGQPKGTYNLADVFLSPFLSFGLLYWGGFFG